MFFSDLEVFTNLSPQDSHLQFPAASKVGNPQANPGSRKQAGPNARSAYRYDYHYDYHGNPTVEVDGDDVVTECGLHSPFPAITPRLQGAAVSVGSFRDPEAGRSRDCWESATVDDDSSSIRRLCGRVIGQL